MTGVDPPLSTFFCELRFKNPPLGVPLNVKEIQCDLS
jgi:hypothetical protein